MSQDPKSTANFFTRESSWTLSHQERDESHVVIFSTKNGLALAVLVYINGTPGSHVLNTKHFAATSTDDAKTQAITWAQENIDSNLTVSSAPERGEGSR